MVASDETHVVGKLTPQQIADAVRNKKYGVDMRETIAQGFEYMFQWYQQISDIQERLTAVEEKQQQFIQLHEGYYADISKNKSDINNNHIDIINLQKDVKRLTDAVFGTEAVKVDYPETENNEKIKAQEVKLQ